MVIGVNNPTISVQSALEHYSGLRSYITSFFEPTEAQPEYKANKAWLDKINGDVNGAFRVYYQNVHGIPRDDVNLSQDLQALAEYDVGCFCLSETNLDWNRPYVKSKYLSRQQKIWKDSATSFSTIDMESSSDYMTGGTLTATVDKWSSRVFKKDADPSGMGRWSYQTLVGKQNTKVTIITGYRCVRNISGESSAWNQQAIFLKDRKSVRSPNPRKQFIKDLTDFINQKRALNHEIILNLDANEVVGEDSQGISKLMSDCNLSDLHDVPGMDPDQQLQDTYRRGNKRRIDFMLGTPKIRECVQRRGALEYNAGIVSNHRGMFIDLNAASLFGGATDDHVAASSRGFTSKNEKKVKKYLDHLDKYFVNHKICSRIDSLAEEAPTLTRRQLK
jgi:hypothetical protein